jgi:Uma2 family endonuclease
MHAQTETALPVDYKAPPSEPEPRVVLYGISWETYERLLEDLADRSVPHLAFDQGVLEIMSPTPEHEEYNRMLALFVDVIAEEFQMNIRSLGSMTIKRQDLLKGFEPDSCFYIQSVARIRGKRRIDMIQDPPPDLSIEIDVTSSSLDRFSIFARIGVPEVWRYDGSQVCIFTLTEGQYIEVTQSVAFPLVGRETITQFLEESLELERLPWLRRLRAWARAQVGEKPPSR